MYVFGLFLSPGLKADFKPQGKKNWLSLVVTRFLIFWNIFSIQIVIDDSENKTILSIQSQIVFEAANTIWFCFFFTLLNNFNVVDSENVSINSFFQVEQDGVAFLQILRLIWTYWLYIFWNYMTFEVHIFGFHFKAIFLYFLNIWIYSELKMLQCMNYIHKCNSFNWDSKKLI